MINMKYDYTRNETFIDIYRNNSGQCQDWILEKVHEIKKVECLK